MTAPATPPYALIAAHDWVTVTEYSVSQLAEDGFDSHHWTVKVEYRGKGRWAVTHHGSCLGRDGRWDYEPLPSSREDEWLDQYRFDSHTEALEAAVRVLPTVTINGLTAQDYLARRAAQNAPSGQSS